MTSPKGPPSSNFIREEAKLWTLIEDEEGILCIRRSHMFNPLVTQMAPWDVCVRLLSPPSNSCIEKRSRKDLGTLSAKFPNLKLRNGNIVYHRNKTPKIILHLLVLWFPSLNLPTNQRRTYKIKAEQVVLPTWVRDVCSPLPLPWNFIFKKWVLLLSNT